MEFLFYADNILLQINLHPTEAINTSPSKTELLPTKTVKLPERYPGICYSSGIVKTFVDSRRGPLVVFSSVQLQYDLFETQLGQI